MFLKKKKVYGPERLERRKKQVISFMEEADGEMSAALLYMHVYTEEKTRCRYVKVSSLSNLPCLNRVKMPP